MMKKKILNTKYSIPNTKYGFSLIELMVAIFIFSVIVVGILSVFVSSTGAYSKARAIKTVKENIEYAENLIAKDVRMGKIEIYYKNVGVGTTTPVIGTLKKYFVVTRNRGGKVCYRLNGTQLGYQELTGAAATNNECSAENPSSDPYQELVDLSNTQMTFNLGSSGFSACPSTYGIKSKCPLTVSADENRRGWVQINLNVDMTSSQEMVADQINVQTVVSSRDYGWEQYKPS